METTPELKQSDDDVTITGWQTHNLIVAIDDLPNQRTVERLLENRSGVIGNCLLLTRDTITSIAQRYQEALSVARNGRLSQIDVAKLNVPRATQEELVATIYLESLSNFMHDEDYETVCFVNADGRHQVQNLTEPITVEY